MKNKIGLAAIVFIVITEIFIMKLLDKREIKFEDFKSSEELQEYLEQDFPKNSSASELISFLKKSEAKCTIIHKTKSGLTLPKDCEYVSQCEGSTGWLSLNPLESYRIIIFSRKNQSIISFSAERIRKLTI